MKVFRKLSILLLILALVLPVQAAEQTPRSPEAAPLAHEPEYTAAITTQAIASALQQPTKQEIAAKWAAVTTATTIFSAEPSVAAPYVAGALTEDFLESGITYLNYVRFVAGLPEVTLDATLNEDAQHGAVVLAAIDELTHYPSQPADMDDAFFDRGAAATSSSNISARWGYSDLTNMLKSAVQGCMNDNNSLGNLTTVGHRRWLLNPTLGKVGFGYAESAENWSYIVTKVFDRSGSGCDFDFISWPVAGNHPTNLFHSQNPWSVTLNTAVFKTVSADTVKITVTRESDGTAWTFDGTTGKPNIDDSDYYTTYIAPYLTVDTQWYGLPNCIIFHPGTDNVESYEGVYQVKITGIYYTDGTAAELNYEVDFFDIDSVSCSHSYSSVVTEPTCEAQGYTTYTCAKCGDSYVSDYTDPVDHSYEDGACIWCGTQYFLASGICGDNLTWVLDREGVLTISGTGAMYDFEYGEAPWGDHLEAIQQVVIPDGATRIGQNAFREAVNIVDVCFSDTVTEIGNWAFMGAEKLAVILLPPNLQVMGQQAFMNCCSLRRIELPAALTFIDGGVFTGCTALTKAVIHGDPNVPSFMMGDAPFRGCTSLEAIEVDELHFCLKDIDGVLYNSSGEELILIQYPAGKKDSVFEIPQGTIEIFQLSMEDVDALEEVIFPDGVQIISRFALSCCDNLHTIRFLGDAPVIQDYAFNGITATAYYPYGNETWTSGVMQNYGGTITWVPYCPGHSYGTVVTEPTCEAQGYTTYTCSICGDSYVSDYTDPVDHVYEDGSCKWCGKEEKDYSITWIQAYASLGGNIALVFQAELSEDLANDPNAFMRFTYAGKTVEVPVSEAVTAGNYHNFYCRITSVNMTDDITAQMMLGDEAIGRSVTTSLEKYCSYIISTSSDAKTQNLMKAMLNYGAAAQQMIGYKLDDLATKNLSEADTVLTRVDASAYKHDLTGSEEGIKPVEALLVLGSETTIRISFQLTGDKPIEAYTFTVDGVETEPVLKGDKYVLEVPNIAAHRLDEMHTFTCGGITITYCGLSYVNQVMNNYTEGTIFNMAVALYNYSQATEAFIA